MRSFNLACPFCSTANPVEVPTGGTGPIRPLCRSCGRMFLVTFRPGLFGSVRRPRVFSL